MLESGRLKTFKACLIAGKPEPVITYLNSEAHGEDLAAIREQKLLVIPANSQDQASVVRAYVAAAEKLLKQTEVANEKNYAAFAVRCTQVFHAISSRIGTQIIHLRTLDKRCVLAIAEDVLSDFEHGMMRDRRSALADHVAGSAGEQSEMSEHLLHEFNGLNNDVLWAVFRAVNEVMKVAPDSVRNHFNRREKEVAKKEFLDLVFQAMEWNGWQYLLDKVSYGEWQVAEISILRFQK